MKARIKEMRRAVAPALTCTGRLREVVEVASDPNGVPVPTYVTRWEGRCLIYPADRDARVVEAAGRSVPLLRYTVMLPHDADVEIGYVLDLSASPDNPSLVGQVFRITDAPHDAWIVLRHCMAETTG